MKKIIFPIILLLLVACSPKVENLGIFAEGRKQDVLGQDGVTPTPISDTIMMWTFGDTILGSWKEGVSVHATFSEKVNPDTMIPNSLAFSRRPTDETVKDLAFTYYKEKGKVSQFLKYRRGENHRVDRLWALDGIRIRDAVYVYYLRIKIDDPGKPMGFRLDGVGLARWQLSRQWKIGDTVTFKRIRDIFANGYPAFGASVIRIKDYIYTLGQYSTKDFTSPIKIARVRAGEIENRKAYRFLQKDGNWIDKIEDAQPFLNDVMGECSLSYNRFLKKYVIIYCQLMTGKIVMVAFDDFSKLMNTPKEVLYQMPKLVPQKNKKEQLFYYSGKEIFSQDSYLYSICIHPGEYQPYLLKVNLSRGISSLCTWFR